MEASRISFMGNECMAGCQSGFGHASAMLLLIGHGDSFMPTSILRRMRFPRNLLRRLG